MSEPTILVTGCCRSAKASGHHMAAISHNLFVSTGAMMKKLTSARLFCGDKDNAQGQGEDRARQIGRSCGAGARRREGTATSGRTDAQHRTAEVPVGGKVERGQVVDRSWRGYRP